MDKKVKNIHLDSKAKNSIVVCELYHKLFNESNFKYHWQFIDHIIKIYINSQEK